MIHLHINSGLGNQLFMYAFARRISLEHDGEEIIIDSFANHFVKLYTVWREAHHYKKSFASVLKTWNNATDTLALRHFKLFDGVSLIQRSSFYSSIIQLPLILQKFLVQMKFIRSGYEFDYANMINRLNAKGRFIFPDAYEYDYTSKAKNKHILMQAQSEKYFKPFSTQIKQELKVVTPPSKENQRLIEEIQGCNSVMVHFRLTSVWQAGTDTYYKRAMDYIAERVENPVFFIFSDKIEYIKENINFDYNVRFVDINNKEGNVATAAHEDLRLMYSCKHAIIAISTFSWWGSYLIDNPDKIVIAPDKWKISFLLDRNPMIYYDGITKLSAE